MFNVETEMIGGATVVHCAGSLVRSEAVNRVRDAVTKESGARIVLLDLSEISRVGSGAIGLLAALQEWTRDHGIQFHLFDSILLILSGKASIEQSCVLMLRQCQMCWRFWAGKNGTQGEIRKPMGDYDKEKWVELYKFCPS